MDAVILFTDGFCWFRHFVRQANSFLQPTLKKYVEHFGWWQVI